MKTLDQLFAEVLGNDELKKEFATAAKDGKVVEFAAAHDVQTTQEEIKAFLQEQQKKMGELSDEELDNVAGGCNGFEGVLSVMSVGVYCALSAIDSAMRHDVGGHGQLLCNYFDADR